MPINGQSRRIDETDNIYGRLVVTGYSHTKISGNKKGGGTRLAVWQCLCECGNTVTVSGKELRRGDSRAVRSCGCSHKTHGHTVNGHSLTYTSWHAMISRCHRDKHYNIVKVCKRWVDSFELFLADMGERPSKKYTI